MAIVSATGLSKDALHIYAGLTLFLVAAILARGKRSLVLPWCAVLLAALTAEALNLRDDIASLGRWRWEASLHDVLNAVFWPTVLTVLGYLGAFRWGRHDVYRLLVADTQQQDAASRRLLRAGQRQRLNSFTSLQLDLRQLVNTMYV